MTDQLGSEPRSPEWIPPSSCLIYRDGIWTAPAVSEVSYPVQGNNAYFHVEDNSYWFRHRLSCILEILGRFPPAGTFWDVGGGNGFVASHLQNQGIDTALLEPGDGVYNARLRGVRHIVKATLEDARLAPHSLPAVGAFDVIEHIVEPAGFLAQVHEALIPGGRFYCTVPAFASLWSAEDEHAGHFRRYCRKTLEHVLQEAGFELEFATYFFTWLVFPLWLLRAVPYRLGLANPSELGQIGTIQADHRLPWMLALVASGFHKWERRRIASRRPLFLGTSVLCVARSR